MTCEEHVPCSATALAGLSLRLNNELALSSGRRPAQHAELPHGVSSSDCSDSFPDTVLTSMAERLLVMLTCSLPGSAFALSELSLQSSG